MNGFGEGVILGFSGNCMNCLIAPLLVMILIFLGDCDLTFFDESC